LIEPGAFIGDVCWSMVSDLLAESSESQPMRLLVVI
jgi:hypothetical protein